MFLDIAKISIYGFNQILKGAVEILINKRNKVEASECWMHIYRGSPSVPEWYQSLIVLNRVFNLLSTRLGADGIRTDDEDKIVSSFNPPAHLLSPICRQRNILKIHPDMAVELLERVIERSHELFVFACVGDKSVNHAVLPDSRIFPLKKQIFAIAPRRAIKLLL